MFESQHAYDLTPGLSSYIENFGIAIDDYEATLPSIFPRAVWRRYLRLGYRGLRREWIIGREEAGGRRLVELIQMYQDANTRVMSLEPTMRDYSQVVRIYNVISTARASIEIEVNPDEYVDSNEDLDPDDDEEGNNDEDSDEEDSDDDDSGDDSIDYNVTGQVAGRSLHPNVPIPAAFRDARLRAYRRRASLSSSIASDDEEDGNPHIQTTNRENNSRVQDRRHVYRTQQFTNLLEAFRSP